MTQAPLVSKSLQMSQQKKGKKGARPSQGGPESTVKKDPGPPLRVDVKEEHKGALHVEGLSPQEIVDKIEARLARPRGRPKGTGQGKTKGLVGPFSIDLDLVEWVNGLGSSAVNAIFRREKTKNQ